MSKSGGSKRVLSAISKLVVSVWLFFEPEEEVVPNPIVGRKKGSVDFDDTLYRRRSELEDIPDDFEKRMMSMGQVESGGLNKEVKMPQDFTVTVAYNKIVVSSCS